MGQTLNMPTLGIFFDIANIHDHIHSGNYLQEAWKVVWRAVGPENLRDYRGALLYECDIAGAESEGCCLAIQSMHKLVLEKIQEALARSADFQLVARPPMFAGESVRSQPLMQAGTIDASGNVVGPGDYCSRPALEEVRVEYTKKGEIKESAKKRRGWLSRIFLKRGNKTASKQSAPELIREANDLVNQRKDLPRAAKLLYRALQLEPRIEGAHSELARISIYSGNIEQAISHFQEELSINTNSCESHVYLCAVYEALGMFAEQKRHYLAASATPLWRSSGGISLASEVIQDIQTAAKRSRNLNK